MQNFDWLIYLCDQVQVYNGYFADKTAFSYYF